MPGLQVVLDGTPLTGLADIVPGVGWRGGYHRTRIVASDFGQDHQVTFPDQNTQPATPDWEWPAIHGVPMDWERDRLVV